MKYLSKLKEELEHLYRIKTPLIWITTQEEELAERAAVSVAAKLHLTDYYYYISNTGGARMDPITLQRSRIVQNQNLGDMFNENSYKYPETLANLASCKPCIKVFLSATIISSVPSSDSSLLHTMTGCA